MADLSIISVSSDSEAETVSSAPKRTIAEKQQVPGVGAASNPALLHQGRVVKVTVAAIPAQQPTQHPTQQQTHQQTNQATTSKATPGKKCQQNIAPVKELSFLSQHTYRFDYKASEAQLQNIDDSQVAECCSVCTFPFDDGDKVRRLQCLHLFHTGCVDNWLNKSKNCPLCRFEIHK